MEYPAGQTQQSAIRNFLGRWQALQGDEYTGALAAIDIAHLMVHAGRFFSVPDVDLDVDIATPKEWLFVTPDDDDLEVHATLGVSSSGQTRFELFEGATASANGTEIVPVNHHRTSTYESQVTAYKDPTITDAGDLIDTAAVGSTGGSVKLGGVARNGAEWDLKPNTVYLLRATAGANDLVMTLSAEYYEFHEDELTWEDPSSSSSA